MLAQTVSLIKSASNVWQWKIVHNEVKTRVSSERFTSLALAEAVAVNVAESHGYQYVETAEVVAARVFEAELISEDLQGAPDDMRFAAADVAVRQILQIDGYCTGLDFSICEDEHIGAY